MSQETIITDKLKQLIGKKLSPVTFEIEKGALRNTADAIGDPNPLWQNEEYARNSKYGSIIAPPTFLLSLKVNEMVAFINEIDCPLKRLLNGGCNIEYLQPIKAGDTITVAAELADLQERTGKTGQMLFMIFKLTFADQRDEPVARMQNTVIKY